MITATTDNGTTLRARNMQNLARKVARYFPKHERAQIGEIFAHTGVVCNGMTTIALIRS